MMINLELGLSRIICFNSETTTEVSSKLMWLVFFQYHSRTTRHFDALKTSFTKMLSRQGPENPEPSGQSTSFFNAAEKAKAKCIATPSV